MEVFCAWCEKDRAHKGMRVIVNDGGVVWGICKSCGNDIKEAMGLLFLYAEEIFPDLPTLTAKVDERGRQS